MTTERLRADARACFAAAVDAVDPGRAVRRHLERDGDALVLRDRESRVLARHRGPVVVIAAGKAAVGMARAVPADDARGIAVAPHGTITADLGRVALRTAAHPVPDAASVEAAAAVAAEARAAGPEVLVLVLVSGGASSLLASPVDGITHDELAATTGALLAAGAEIGALNAVRKHCSRLQGGGLAREAGRAGALWTLLLSDVVGDAPDTIGSGPTVADPTTFADALAALDRYGVDAPSSVRRHLERGVAGTLPETEKAARGRVVVVGKNGDAVAAAAGAAAGYAVTSWPAPLTGDAAEAGRAIAHALLAGRGPRPIGIVAGGETTVRAVADGVGGRSQHLALAAALEIAGTTAVVLAAGTDGVDGPTDAAGACVDGGTVGRATRLGLDPGAALARTDSNRLLAVTGDLVVTGPTGTNVADLVVALAPPA